MTKKKELKQRVRARQEKTGESYTAALAQIRQPSIPEAPSATAEAVAEGLRCEAVISPKLRGLGNLRPLFARLRAMLEGLGAQACGPLLRGEAGPRRMPQMRDMLEARAFLGQVRTGRRGLSENGQSLALVWNEVTVVVFISLLGRRPLLQLCLLDELAEPWSVQLALLGIGR
jgi:hypothetical protein